MGRAQQPEGHSEGRKTRASRTANQEGWVLAERAAQTLLETGERSIPGLLDGWSSQGPAAPVGPRSLLCGSRRPRLMRAGLPTHHRRSVGVLSLIPEAGIHAH